MPHFRKEATIISLGISLDVFCHVSLKHVINKQASPPPQATESRTPYFLDPDLHLVCIHPAFFLCRNNDAVLVVHLRQSFLLEDHHALKFSAVSSTRQHDRDRNLLVSRGTNFNGLLADAVDGAVWWLVKCKWSFIHVSGEV